MTTRSMKASRLLISVRSAAEAGAALAGGADWIDLKEPDRGPLGAVEAAAARETVAAVAGRVPVSAAGGELIDWPRGDVCELQATPGLSFFKLGLSGLRHGDWRDRWQAAADETAAAGVQLVVVIYADAARAAAPDAEDVARFAATAPCAWTLVDTFDKSGGPLEAHLPPARLRGLLASLRAAGRRTVVAGSLDRAAVARLPLELVDMVAVRGAACAGGRQGTVCAERVARLRTLLARCAAGAGGPTADFTGRKEFA